MRAQSIKEFLAGRQAVGRMAGIKLNIRSVCGDDHTASKELPQVPARVAGRAAKDLRCRHAHNRAFCPNHTGQMARSELQGQP